MIGSRLAAAVTSALIFTVAATCNAVVEELFWGDGSNGPLTSGTHAWETKGNWTNDDPPDEFVETNDGEAANIGNVTGNRTITTSTFLRFHDLQWTQSTPGVVNRIKLGEDWVARTNQNVITNSTGDAATMVFDVNGNQADFNSSALQMSGWLVTWTSSQPGGLITNDTIGLNANAIVGPNVTLQANSTGGNILQGHWDITATFRARPGNATSRFDWIRGTGIGNIVVGDGVTEHLMTWGTDSNSAVQVIKGNVTVMEKGRWVFGANAQGSRFIVGGNFIDTNTDNLGYGGDSSKDDVLIFALSPSTARTVDVRRTGLTNDVQVGSNYAGVGNGTFGHIALAHDFTTAGSFRILGGSTVDLTVHDLNTGTFTLDDGAAIGLTLGPTTSLISVTDLSLDDFVLRVLTLPNNGWQNGSDLVLFNYSDALNNLMSLDEPTIIVSDGWLRYDAFVAEGGVVMLTNVWVPEPGVAATLLAMAGLLQRRRR